MRAPSGRHGDGYVYCVPVTPDFFKSHQWGRELRRGGYRSSIAVVFVIPDGDIVTVGRFGLQGAEMTAAEAVAHFLSQEDTLGHEVRIGRRILPAEIRWIRPAPPTVGWRFYPESKGERPTYQPRGTIKARRVRDRIEAWYGWRY